MEKTFYAGFKPLGIAISPGGDRIYVTNFQSGLVKVVDGRTHRITDDVKVGGMPTDVVVSPRGHTIYVANYGRGRIGRVDFIDTASHRVTKSVEVGVRPLVAAISPLASSCTFLVPAPMTSM